MINDIVAAKITARNIAHALYVNVTSLRMAVIFVRSRILNVSSKQHTTETK